MNILANITLKRQYGREYKNSRQGTRKQNASKLVACDYWNCC